MTENETKHQEMLKKGDCRVCEVCGLSVTIDEVFAYKENATLLCCGEPMKPKDQEEGAAKAIKEG